MKTTVCTILCISILALGSCKKDKNVNTDTSTLEGQVLVDFSNKLVNPNYQDIQAKASIMNDAANVFVTSSTEDNLLAVRQAWKNTRKAWESCEGFLFGPVEDDNYDPDMDDWPVNKVDLDALLASSNALTVSDVDQLETTLKGFHAIEYVIFGVGSTRKAADITDREKTYLLSLTQSLFNTTTALRDSWDPAHGNYTAKVVNAGAPGNTTYQSRQAVFSALVGSMTDICDEVANNKMQKPFTLRDSTQSESSFSHNSVSDFTNNITGIKNAYLSSYNGVGGHSLSELVALKNAQLNNTLLSQMNAAIASFNAFANLNVTYEEAIYSQRSTITNVQNTINKLKATLDGDLQDFVRTNIKD